MLKKLSTSLFLLVLVCVSVSAQTRARRSTVVTNPNQFETTQSPLAAETAAVPARPANKKVEVRLRAEGFPSTAANSRIELLMRDMVNAERFGGNYKVVSGNTPLTLLAVATYDYPKNWQGNPTIRQSVKKGGSRLFDRLRYKIPVVREIDIRGSDIVQEVDTIREEEVGVTVRIFLLYNDDQNDPKGFGLASPQYRLRKEFFSSGQPVTRLIDGTNVGVLLDYPSVQLPPSKDNVDGSAETLIGMLALLQAETQYVPGGHSKR